MHQCRLHNQHDLMRQQIGNGEKMGYHVNLSEAVTRAYASILIQAYVRLIFCIAYPLSTLR